jgi:hypothetical protein
VEGIFCDLEKGFECVDRGILLSKFEIDGINGKDLALYQSYLDNRYFITAVYNDSDDSNKVSSWVKVRHGVTQGSVLGPVIFLLYLNVLHKITNKTSAPIIFADYTMNIILFAHSNLMDFNKNIHIVFVTLNKWFRANQLSINFNKTNYVSCTKFLGLTKKCKIVLKQFLYAYSFYTLEKYLNRALRYKPEGRGIDSRWCNWNFSLT